MTTQITSSEERILQDAVKSGMYSGTQAALSDALLLLREKTETQLGNELPKAAWRDQLQKHLANTPKSEANHVDVSREGIYEGRGE